jgi:tetraacyldisaccharide 4'-kinase
MSALERLWYGDSAGARLIRAGLAPAELLYGAAVRVRGALYDRGVLASHRVALPVLAIGNVSVGGTGKTPVAAWAVSRLREQGARPALLLRGYGDDEPLVHQTLNPGVPVITDADRVRGATAAQSAGADCVVLDDAFQHRRLARTADWVLLSAERFERSTRLLPAGPLREPVRAIGRADVVVVTRKTEPREHAARIAAKLEFTRDVVTAVIHLAPSGVVDARDGTARPLEVLRNTRLAAVAAVGEPAAFFTQLRDAGAREVIGQSYRDHHRFSADDVRRILHAAASADAVVCTLKDAVKLAPLWPVDVLPLWYVSQRAEVERGAHVLDASLALLLGARASTPSTAGAAG